MEVFYNRQREAERIRKAINSNFSEFVVVYGRRRIGKSTLLRNVLGKKDVYYVATMTEASLQRQMLADAIAEVIPGFNSVLYPHWESLFNQISKEAKQKITICLDEFPYLLKSSPELPSVLQKWYDNNKNGKCSVILCGSSQQMMHSLAFNSQDPLYGRATEIIKLEPLPIGYICDALKINAIKSVEEYSLWGGIPRYWMLRKKYKTLYEALNSLIFENTGILHHEPMQLFLDEMRESVQPYTIMSIIAAGANKISEIAARLEKPATQLSRPLDNLVQLGYLKKEIPFGEKPKNTKRSLYKINDPFMALYFRVVIPNISFFQVNSKSVIEKKVAPLLQSLFAERWEDIAREYVSKHKIAGLSFLNPSRWWNNEYEFDIVAATADQSTILIGECKWADVDNTESIITLMLHKAEKAGLTQNKKVLPVLFAKRFKNLKKQKGCYYLTPENIVSKLK